MTENNMERIPEQQSGLGRMIRFCLENRVVVVLFVVLVIVGGVIVAPFDWQIGGLPRYPVAVDAIPDIGENQQIVFTEWMGRSPQDVEDQITYPLTVSLLGIPGVRTIRSNSFFGFSTIYVIFEENVDFYWSRSRILEKLASLSAGTLPEGVKPTLGPDATALGQIYWYTLEGRDPDGNVTGGWDLEELRTIQDWTVRYALMGAEGVAEVASVGGFVREYQVDVDPDAMRAYGVTIQDIYRAVQASNIDVGAKTLELNRVEYFIRGIGFVERVEDIENSVIKVVENVPVLVRHVAHVTLGPALRRGALDKGGAETVGGVVVARFGENPLAAINHVKDKIAEIEVSLPRKAVVDFERTALDKVKAFAQSNGFMAYRDGQLNQDQWVEALQAMPREEWPQWVTLSQVSIVPFYDRTGLIYETLGTLNRALTEEILITIIVVVLMVMHLRSSVLIGGLLPLAVLMCFIAMKIFGVDANIVALSGIAIAIGTMVDMGIVICENILRHLDQAGPNENRLEVVHRASSEVGSAVLTAVATTVISFLPVFTMIGAEGKLFRPLAFTKTFALIASIIVALMVIPPAAYLLFRKRQSVEDKPPWRVVAANGIVVFLIAVLLARKWEPLGGSVHGVFQFIFVAVIVLGLLGLFWLFRHFYSRILRWCLAHKAVFLSLPLVIVVLGVLIWRGLGREFMPPLDEGSFLYMPTTMVHASIGEALDILSKQDMAFSDIPEIDTVVGKIGRAQTPLDPAPISMIETVINYKSEFITDEDGHRIKFRYRNGEFVRDENGELIPDQRGRPYRQWRDHIQSPDDIWDEIVKAGDLTGTTSAPELQPIAARLVMLQSGMRAPMGVKVKGPTLETIDKAALAIESALKTAPGVDPSTVIADRVVGKPYLEIVADREALARYGVPIRAFADVVEIAIGGKPVTYTVEGRERFAIRIRYLRELRDEIDTLGDILVPGSGGVQIPLEQVASIRYHRGPQMIRSEDTFLTAYVLLDKHPGWAEVDVVEACQAYLNEQIADGKLILPQGVSYAFAGTYENQVRARKTLAVVLPVALLAIFLILYLHFNSSVTAGLVFTGILVAWSGGFILIWLYGQSWFLDVNLFGLNLRELFQVTPVNLSVAVWVGFLALFGIATDDGVVMATYLEQSFRRRVTQSRDEIREATVAAGEKRVRACLMTTATTILALLPVLTSTGRGSDVMVPMAIPVFGGMLIEILTMLVVPVLYCMVREWLLWRNGEIR